MKSCGIITLTTDFGDNDGFVGAMRGRLLRLAPQALVYDISHNNPPQDIYAAAWCLRRAAPEWPQGTIHMAVVDPEVGSDREALAICSPQGWFIGPDNGVLTLAAEHQGISQVWAIDRQALSPNNSKEKTTTFDGLNLFVPLAVKLLQGTALSSLGQEIEDYNRIKLTNPIKRGNWLIGHALLPDRFGNCITDITREDLPQLRQIQTIQCGKNYARTCTHYSELLKKDEVGALFNSSGYLELAIFCKSVWKHWNLHQGAEIQIQLES